MKTVQITHVITKMVIYLNYDEFELINGLNILISFVLLTY